MYRVRDGVGQPQLLREGWAAVLRVRLLHSLLPALRPLQQAHPKREKLGCAKCRVAETYSQMKRCGHMHTMPFNFFLLFCVSENGHSSG